jgi:hypothetical protein
VGLGLHLGLNHIDGGIEQQMRERRLGNGGSDSGNNLEGGIDRAPRIPDQVTLTFFRERFGNG